jgi:hypothetical protein
MEHRLTYNRSSIDAIEASMCLARMDKMRQKEFLQNSAGLATIASGFHDCTQYILGGVADGVIYALNSIHNISFNLASEGLKLGSTVTADQIGGWAYHSAFHLPEKERREFAEKARVRVSQESEVLLGSSSERPGFFQQYALDNAAGIASEMLSDFPPRNYNFDSPNPLENLSPSMDSTTEIFRRFASGENMPTPRVSPLTASSDQRSSGNTLKYSGSLAFSLSGAGYYYNAKVGTSMAFDTESVFLGLSNNTSYMASAAPIVGLALLTAYHTCDNIAYYRSSDGEKFQRWLGEHGRAMRKRGISGWLSAVASGEILRDNIHRIQEIDTLSAVLLEKEKSFFGQIAIKAQGRLASYLTYSSDLKEREELGGISTDPAKCVAWYVKRQSKLASKFNTMIDEGDVLGAGRFLTAEIERDFPNEPGTHMLRAQWMLADNNPIASANLFLKTHVLAEESKLTYRKQGEKEKEAVKYYQQNADVALEFAAVALLSAEDKDRQSVRYKETEKNFLSAVQSKGGIESISSPNALKEVANIHWSHGETGERMFALEKVMTISSDPNCLKMLAECYQASPSADNVRKYKNMMRSEVTTHLSENEKVKAFNGLLDACNKAGDQEGIDQLLSEYADDSQIGSAVRKQQQRRKQLTYESKVDDIVVIGLCVAAGWNLGRSVTRRTVSFWRSPSQGASNDESSSKTSLY